MKCAWKELLAILPSRMRPEVDKLGRETLQEIRLRMGKPVSLVCGNEMHHLPLSAKQDELQYIIHMASQYSPWTATTLAQGYLTSAGGHRIGICGQALIRNGRMDGVGTLTSVNIRVARDYPDISGNLKLRRDNILILGPPGSGKTTLLRDLVRQRSQYETVSVVDERGEIFPLGSDFDSGVNTDVLSGCSKAEGISRVLRTMNPSCIAVDEITAREDCDALMNAGWCGVSLLATAHASALSDLRNRAVYQPLGSCGLFHTAVILRRDKTWYTERIRV